MERYTIPGLTFAGYTCNLQVNNGKPIPLYDIAEPHDGRLSINTLEGWNAMVEREEALRRERMQREYEDSDNPAL